MEGQHCDVIAAHVRLAQQAQRGALHACDCVGVGVGGWGWVAQPDCGRRLPSQRRFGLPARGQHSSLGMLPAAVLLASDQSRAVLHAHIAIRARPRHAHCRTCPLSRPWRQPCGLVPWSPRRPPQTAPGSGTCGPSAWLCHTANGSVGVGRWVGCGQAGVSASMWPAPGQAGR